MLIDFAKSVDPRQHSFCAPNDNSLRVFIINRAVDAKKHARAGGGHFQRTAADNAGQRDAGIEF